MYLYICMYSQVANNMYSTYGLGIILCLEFRVLVLVLVSLLFSSLLSSSVSHHTNRFFIVDRIVYMYQSASLTSNIPGVLTVY